MTGIRDKVNEIIEEMGVRVRNPLVLSFILVWLYLHWKLIYMLFTMDMTLPMDNRVGYLRIYIINHDEWWGMIGIPLVWSFFSLTAYYLIAIAGQAIRVLVWKRFNAFMLLKVDRGAFALKTELAEERRRNNKLVQELNGVKDSLARHLNENSTLQSEKAKLSVEFNKLSAEYETAKSNIYNNPKFIEKFSNTLVVLLAKANKVEGITIRKGEVLKSHFAVINGNWNGLYGSFLPQHSGTSLYMIVDNEKITDFQGNDLGEIENFSFDKSLNLIHFKLKRTKESPQHYEMFYLIMINRNEMIGLYNDNFISFKREE